MEFSESLVRSLLESSDPFSIDFDDAWRWIGYTRKDSAKKKLLNNFEENIDFKILQQTAENSAEQRLGGRPIEEIRLSIDCFKSLAMMAGTEKGRDVRQYFLRIEREYKQIMQQPHSLTLSDRDIELISDRVVEKFAVALPALKPAPRKPITPDLMSSDELPDHVRQQNRRELWAASRSNTWLYRNLNGTARIVGEMRQNEDPQA